MIGIKAKVEAPSRFNGASITSQDNIPDYTEDEKHSSSGIPIFDYLP